MACALRLLLPRRAGLWSAPLLLAAVAFGPPPIRAAIAVKEAWVHRYSKPVRDLGHPQASKVITDITGDVIVIGTIDDNSITSPQQHALTIKYSGKDGSLIWQRRYNGPGGGSYDSASGVAVDGSGSVVVVGSSGASHFSAKYAAADGAILWENLIPGASNDGPFVATDHDNNVVVSGAFPNRNGGVWSDSDKDYFTAKYAAADGTLLWEKYYDGPAHRDDYATAMALDLSGNVVVTGTSYNGGGTGDYFTAKYAAADGAILWEKRFSDPGTSIGAFPTAVAVDVDGNVVVTGSIENLSNADFYTVKYAAADGAILWEKRYNGPANFDDRAQAVVTDGSGNVVVTGYSFDSRDIAGNFYDYAFYTAKYRAKDGALLWERRYNGPANLANRAIAVAVDGSGNVVVTGSSATGGKESTGFIHDYYTAKYAAADGALLWEMRYNGPANGDDYPSSLALGPNGMVVVAGSSARSSGYDYATVVYREGLPPVAIERVPTGVRLRFTGIAGRGYNLERAPAVTGPWNTINTQTTPASGLLEYLDTNAPATTAFYRTVQP